MRFLILIGVLCLVSLPALSEATPPQTSDPSPAPPTRPADLGTSAFASVPPGLIITAPEDSKCTLQYQGAERYSVRHNALLLCDGKRWNILKMEPLAP